MYQYIRFTHSAHKLYLFLIRNVSFRDRRVRNSGLSIALVSSGIIASNRLICVHSQFWLDRRKVSITCLGYGFL